MTTDTIPAPDVVEPAHPVSPESAHEQAALADHHPVDVAESASESHAETHATDHGDESHATEETIEDNHEGEPLTDEGEVAGDESESAESEGGEAPTPVKPGEPGRNPNFKWYVVKVQSGREDSIKEAIERRVKIEGVEEHFGQVVVPVEREVIVIQSGKRKGQKQIRKKKKFPGYVMAEVEYNDRILYLFRETSGVGDFVGGSLTRAPQPMSEREVKAMLSSSEEPVVAPGEKKPKAQQVIVAPKKLPYGVGDKVKVRDGTFQNMEGEVKNIREPKDPKDAYQIDVELTVWGRPVKVQLDYWQIDPV